MTREMREDVCRMLRIKMGGAKPEEFLRLDLLEKRMAKGKELGKEDLEIILEVVYRHLEVTRRVMKRRHAETEELREKYVYRTQTA